jgi:phosphoribosylanthranilate isomerase
MTKVKICGVTCVKDIEIVNALLPDYAGFVFAKSKRWLSLEDAIKLCGMLDPRVKKAGVFVNETRENIQKTIDACGLGVVQLHGEERYGDDTFEGCAIWKAIRVKDGASLQGLDDHDAEAFVLDAYSKDAYGGTGKTFDWSLAKNLRVRIVLAGGLTPENVRGAIQALRPFAVDVSSGVEANGAKDYDKVKRFIEIVRNLK